MEKGELRAWNLIHAISAYEAALLIGGVDPARTDIGEMEKAQARVFEKAIHEAVTRADFLAWQLCDDKFAEEMPVTSDIWEMEPDYEKYLPTFEIRNSVAEVLKNPDDVPVLLGIDPWYSATVYAGDFKAWLTRNGVRSSYEFQDHQAIVVTKLDHSAVINAERERNGLPPFDEELRFAKAEQSVATLLTPDRPLGTRERNTMLCIIAALCKDLGYDHTKHAKTAGLILSTAAGMGLSIGETTIENKLKEIANALESRMK
jgi:hypothetical protein